MRSAVASVRTSGVTPTGMRALVGGLDVDVVEANGVVGNDFELGRRVEGSGVDVLGQHAQQAVGVGETVAELGGVGRQVAGPDLDVVAGVGEAIKRIAGQRAGDEDVGHR